MRKKRQGRQWFVPREETSLLICVFLCGCWISFLCCRFFSICCKLFSRFNDIYIQYQNQRLIHNWWCWWDIMWDISHTRGYTYINFVCRRNENEHVISKHDLFFLFLWKCIDISYFNTKQCKSTSRLRHDEAKEWAQDFPSRQVGQAWKLRKKAFTKVSDFDFELRRLGVLI